MAILNKIELDDLLALMVVQFESLFPDNGVGAISAADLRTFMQTQIDYLTVLNGSLKLQRLGVLPLNNVVENLVAADIDENTFFTHNNVGAQVVNLPEVTAELNGIVTIGIMNSADPVTFVPFAGGTVYGSQPNSDGVYSLIPVFAKLGWFLEFKPAV